MITSKAGLPSYESWLESYIVFLGKLHYLPESVSLSKQMEIIIVPTNMVVVQFKLNIIYRGLEQCLSTK